MDKKKRQFRAIRAYYWDLNDENIFGSHVRTFTFCTIDEARVCAEAIAKWKNWHLSNLFVIDE